MSLAAINVVDHIVNPLIKFSVIHTLKVFLGAMRKANVFVRSANLVRMSQQASGSKFSVTFVMSYLFPLVAGLFDALYSCRPCVAADPGVDVW
jgi:hypothetical protein